MGGNFWDGARNGAISAGLNHAMHYGHMELSGVNQLAKNAEEVLDRLYKVQVGVTITGEDLAKMNPKLSMADNAIDQLIRTETGFKLELTWLGRSALSLTKISINDGSHFDLTQLYNGSDRIFNVKSPGNKVIYGSKGLVDLNIYINNNNYSIYRDFKTYIQAW